MRKNELEKMLQEIDVDKRVSKVVRYHCIAFWSGMMGLFGLIGSFITANSLAFKAAMKTFLEVWLPK